MRDLNALWVEIQANPACAPHIHTNDLPKLDAASARAKDQAIADILSAGRVQITPFIATERSVREALPIVDGAEFLKLLRDMAEQDAAPAWIGAVLAVMQVPAEQHWAYHDALRCGWPWLRGTGLDVASSRVRQMLDLIAAGVPSLASACATLKALAEQPDVVSADEVSRAVRGPRE